MTRVRAFFPFVAVLALAIGLSACGGGGSGSSDESPTDVLKGASFEGIESGDLDLHLKVDSTGKEGGNADITLTGPFQKGAKGKLPELQMNAEVKYDAEGESGEKEIGFTLPLPKRRSSVTKGPNTKSTRAPSASSNRRSSRPSRKAAEKKKRPPARKRRPNSKPEEFVDNLKNEGGEDVGGTETTKVSGDLDVPSAIEAITKLVENPACSSQLEQAGPLPLGELGKAKTEIESAVKTAHADVYVGDDKIVRRVSADLTVEPRGLGASRSTSNSTSRSTASTKTRRSPLRPTRSPWKASSRNSASTRWNCCRASRAAASEACSKAPRKTAAFPASVANPKAPPVGPRAASRGGGAQKKYLECVQGANGAAELQKCVEDLQ